MVGRILTLFQIEQLFRVDLGIFVLQATAAIVDGDERESHFLEVSHAVVGDIPAHAAPY